MSLKARTTEAVNCVVWWFFISIGAKVGQHKERKTIEEIGSHSSGLCNLETKCSCELKKQTCCSPNKDFWWDDENFLQTGRRGPSVFLAFSSSKSSDNPKRKVSTLYIGMLVGEVETDYSAVRICPWWGWREEGLKKKVLFRAYFAMGWDMYILLWRNAFCIVWRNKPGASYYQGSKSRRFVVGISAFLV